MKILVGYPPLKSDKGFPLLSQNRQFQWFNNPSIIFPIVLASAATLLKKNNYEVIWLDAIAEKTNEKTYFELIKKEQPDLIAFETKTPVIKQHWKFIDKLKSIFPKIKIVLMGDHVTALPEESFKKSKVDFIITGGDYDFSLLELCNHLKENNGMPQGIYYREHEVIKNNGSFKLEHNLDELPLIDRNFCKWQNYEIEYNIKQKPFMYIMSGRDCPYGKCKFCSWPTLFPIFRVRSVNNVLDEIGILIEKYNIKEIFDDTGTFPSGDWLVKFCNEMIEKGYNKKIKFSCNMRVDYITDERAKLMKQAGFRLLKFGLESGNQKTLDRINKGIKVEQIRKACEICKKNGLEVHLTMMVGYPWETKNDALNTLKLAKELMLSGKADVLQATIVIPYPGTPLYKEVVKGNLLLINKEDYERYDMREPIMKSSIPPKEIMQICDNIYKIFFDPRYIFRRIISIKNLADFKYTFRGIKAIFGHLKDFGG